MALFKSQCKKCICMNNEACNLSIPRMGMIDLNDLSVLPTRWCKSRSEAKHGVPPSTVHYSSMNGIGVVNCHFLQSIRILSPGIRVPQDFGLIEWDPIYKNIENLHLVYYFKKVVKL